MLDKFKQWYNENDIQVTWFLIGVLVTAGLDSLATQSYGQALLFFMLAWINWKLRHVKLS
jgi:hypothetical protein